MSASVNKAFIGTQPPLFFTYCVWYGCFQAIVAELSSCIRDLRAQKVKNIYCDPLQNKLANFCSSWLEKYLQVGC